MGSQSCPPRAGSIKDLCCLVVDLGPFDVEGRDALFAFDSEACGSSLPPLAGGCEPTRFSARSSRIHCWIWMASVSSCSARAVSVRPCARTMALSRSTYCGL